MKIKVYSTLPEEAKIIRTQVFVKEQGFSKDLEFDEYENIATHLVGFIDEDFAATSRFYYSKNHNAYLIGRIAVKKEHRKKGLGALIVAGAEEEIKKIGGEKAVIHAQLRVKKFYESIGYQAFGEIDLEEGVEHIMMEKSLSKKTKA